MAWVTHDGFKPLIGRGRPMTWTDNTMTRTDNAMTNEFHRVIANLWRSLGLSSPRFRPEGTTTLMVDGFEIKLALLEDGHIAVSGRAGRLSTNPVRMDEQISRLLTANLRMLSHNRACCWLEDSGFDDQGAEPPMAVIEALSPCSAGSMNRLVETIGDVAHLAGEYSRELGGSAPQPRAERVEEESFSDDMVIFRP
jgi:hypothetical protein